MEQATLTDEELHAFIDGELAGERMEAIALMVADSEELAERVGQFIADKDLIGRVYGPLIRQPVPLAMARQLVSGRSRAEARPPSARFFPAGLALAALIVSAVIGYPVVSNLIGDPLVVEALAVRAGKLRPQRQFADTEIATAATRDQLVDAALSVPIKVPNLTKSGYTLAGITAYPDRGGHQALQISYRDRNGALFTLFLRRSGGADRFELSRRRNLEVCVWQNDNLSVVMLGEMPAKDMLRVATATYADLDF